jgi:hypothetical protein
MKSAVAAGGCCTDIDNQADADQHAGRIATTPLTQMEPKFADTRCPPGSHHRQPLRAWNLRDIDTAMRD